MPHRPWPIIVLALSQFAAPLFNILLNSWMLQQSPNAYIDSLFRNSTPLELFNFLILIPIGGIAIYACKRWSYPVFVGIVIWAFYWNYHHYTIQPETYSLAALIGVYLFNLVVVSYFLIPEVRLTYFDPSIRWWERHPRFQLEIPAKISVNEREEKFDGTVKNISQGGLFLSSSTTIEKGSFVKLEINIMGQPLRVQGHAVHHNKSQGGYGIEFNFEGLLKEKKAIKSLTHALDRLDFKRQPKRRAAVDFFDWALKVPSGKGLVPQPFTQKKPTPEKDHTKR